MILKRATIDFEECQDLGTSMTEYVLCSIVYNLSANPNNRKATGWCYAKREAIGQLLGITRRGVIKLIDRMMDAGLIERNEKNELRTTQKWYITTVAGREQSSRAGVNKVPVKGEQSSNPHLYSNINIGKDVPSEENSSGDTPSEKPQKKNVKRVNHLFLKGKTAFFELDLPIMGLPDRKRLITAILAGEWHIDTTGTEIVAQRLQEGLNEKDLKQVLLPFGLAKYFHDHLVEKWGVEKYLDVRKAKVNAYLNEARLMMSEDKRESEDIQEIIEWMFDERADPFWGNTCRSMRSLRDNFDKMQSKMEADIARLEKTNSAKTLSFSIIDGPK